jgi:hypothetical protein
MNKTRLFLTFIFVLKITQSFSRLGSLRESSVIDISSSTNVSNENSKKIDTTRNDLLVKGGVTITNKGISYIPNFSLGDPAFLFDFSIDNTKISFEPQLRFSLKGVPWSFQFPVRYKINTNGKLKLSVGINPLLNFRNISFLYNGVTTKELVNRRYLGGEFRPTYELSKTISVGVVYLYFRGMSDFALKNTNFVSLQANFSNITIGHGFFLRCNTQIYYLNQNDFSGLYVNPVLTLFKNKFPFSVQTIMNATIHTIIPDNEPFISNLSLIYAFNKTYTRIQK